MAKARRREAASVGAGAGAGAEELEDALADLGLESGHAGAGVGATQQNEDPKLSTTASVAATAPSIPRPPPLEEFLEAHAPAHLLCPIALALMNDPVVLFANDCTYARATIEEHFDLCRASALAG